MMKDVPKREQAQFAAKWGRSMRLGRPEDWFDFFSFPKCILLSPPRGGSQADLVHSRLAQWETEKREGAVLGRGDKKKSPNWSCIKRPH